MHETSTRSPGFTFLTPAPTDSTVPTASWPRIRPSVTAGTSPLRMCRSVPQIVDRVDPDDRVGVVDDRGVGDLLPGLLAGAVVHECLHLRLLALTMSPRSGVGVCLE